MSTSLTRRALPVALLACKFSPTREAATVPPPDLARIRLSDFADQELLLAEVLPHLPLVANHVRMEAPHRGFIDIPVWRYLKDNRPYNARVMENILSLAWFYRSRRPWNPYHAHPALRLRLEAALDFWCSIQDPQGRFSEYGEGKWNLAATAFAVKFMGEALRLLKDGPPLDRTLYQRALEACRKAMVIVLEDATFWKQGCAYTNQYTNVFAGGPAYLEVRPDAALYRRLVRRLEESSSAFQSPCGYFYEADGPDFGYNLGTQQHNVRMAWHYFRTRPEAEIFVRQQELFSDWLGYNAWPESEGLWVLNRSVETRQRHAVTGPVDTPVGERSILARAFARSQDQVARDWRRLRARLQQEWPKVPPLALGQPEAFSPYLFLHLGHFDWHPSAKEVEQARQRLPARRSLSYLHERMDSRYPVVFHYVRRPTYVAAFASGPLIRPQQRLGLTLVWTPKAGAVLQSQTGGSETAWGTAVSGSGPGAVEGARFRLGNSLHVPKPGIRDIALGAAANSFEIEFPLAGGGWKRVRFEESAIAVEVNCPGEWVENIPLLQVTESQQLCGLEVEGLQVSRTWGEGPVVGDKRLKVVSLRGRGGGKYRLLLSG